MTGNMTGRVFNNRYQLTECIGIGGMAEVYRAQDNVLGRLVAVKVMLPQYAADPNFTARFKQEAAAAANLQSPYIVNVYDWGQDDGTYYIVMEFVRGSDLKTAIKERGAINQRKVAEIGSQVCQALSVAHNLDIIHRDIKPQNIMVQPDGNVKVMDFGIARAKNSVMTQTSSVLGTAHYISPEQAQGKELTATSDIYSLGVVMYEAATGQLPFDGPDAVSVAMMQVNDQPLPPHELNPDLDPSLEAIIMRALSKKPTERFATAQDMRYALNDYLAGRPLSGGPFTSAETAVIGGVIPPIGPADGTAVMPPMSGGTNPAVMQGKDAKNFNASNSRKKNPKKIVAIVVGVLIALALVGLAAYALTGGFSAGDPVPDVTGMTTDEASETLKKAGFELGEVQQQYDDKIESGKIMGQNPRPGSKAAKGSKVSVTISQGVEQIAVPDVSGMSMEEAKQKIKDMGLIPSAAEAQHSDSVPKGNIVGTNPEAGTKVDKGSTVEYIASLGPEGTAVPNVVGKLKGEATSALQNAGFKVTTDSASSDTVPEGKVISQNPSAGQLLNPGDTVNIVVSTGKEKPKSHKVTANVSGGGGNVSPTSMSVDEGGSVTFVITPNPGYVVAKVTDTNGNTYTVSADGGSFTVKNVKNDVTVTVTFSQKTPDPTPSGGGDKN